MNSTIRRYVDYVSLDLPCVLKNTLVVNVIHELKYLILELEFQVI